MRVPSLSQTRIREGVWEGILSGNGGDAPPSLRAWHSDRDLGPAQTTPADDGVSWWVRIPIPTDCLNEGVQSFLVEDTSTGETLARFSIIAGEVADDALVAEVALLRAELDMLKRAFRRHVANVDT